MIKGLLPNYNVNPTNLILGEFLVYYSLKVNIVYMEGGTTVRRVVPCKLSTALGELFKVTSLRIQALVFQCLPTTCRRLTAVGCVLSLLMIFFIKLCPKRNGKVSGPAMGELIG